MYMSQMISVGKAQNGFVIECRVPLKPDAKKSKTMDMCCSPSCEKQYIAKDAAEVGKLIADIMPLLDSDFKTEDEFDSAFSKASGMEEKKMMKGGMK